MKAFASYKGSTKMSSIDGENRKLMERGSLLTITIATTPTQSSF